jgi:prophage maintenance system killer protein
MSELDFQFLASNQILAIHRYTVQKDGGRLGVRDRHALENAVLAPRRTAAGQRADAFDLAAIYADSLTRNRPFVESNQRTALTSALVFLGLNHDCGHHFKHDDLETAMLYLTNGQIRRDQWAQYLRAGFDGVPGSWVDDPDGRLDEPSA